jgi:hypothetical protein
MIISRSAQTSSRYASAATGSADVSALKYMAVQSVKLTSS